MIQKILEAYGKHLEKTVSHKRALIAIKNLSPLYKSTVRDLLAISPGGRENEYYNGDNSEYIQAKLNWKPLANTNPG